MTRQQRHELKMQTERETGVTYLYKVKGDGNCFTGFFYKSELTEPLDVAIRKKLKTKYYFVGIKNVTCTLSIYEGSVMVASETTNVPDNFFD